jgi:hypothetical protein
VLEASKKIASDLQQATLHWNHFYWLSQFQLADLGYGLAYSVPTGTSGGVSISANAPQRLYFVVSRRVVLSADAVPSYGWVNQSGAHGQFGLRTRADAQFIFNRLYLDLYAGRANELRPHFGELNRVFTIKDREAGISGELKYSSRSSALFSARYRSADYPTDELQPIDFEKALLLLARREQNYRASILHKTFPLTSVIAAVERSNYSFKVDPSRDSRRTYAGVGVIIDSGKSVIKAEAGPGKLTFKHSADKEFSGILGNVSASRRVGERWRASASALRDLDLSIYGPNRYYIADRLSIGADYAATRRLSFKLINEFGRDSYEVRLFGLPLRRDTISWNAVGWTYTTRKLRGGFDVGYYRRDTNVPEVDKSNGIRFVLHLSLTP